MLSKSEPAPVRPYHFAMRVNGSVERLGSIALRSDEDAIAFGKQVVQDLVRMYPEGYSGSALVITEHGRSVGRVTVD